jgi:signal transduction histidine kinase
MSGVIFSAIALTCYIALIAITVHQRANHRTAQAFVLYLAAVSFWQLAALMVSLSTKASSALLWYRLMTAGMGGQFIFYLFFILVFLGQPRWRHVFYAGWLIFIALLASNGTQLVIADVSPSSVTGLFVPSFGPLVPVVGIVAYAFLGYGAYSLIQSYRTTTSHLQRNRIRYLLIGLGLIALGSLSNLASALQSYPIDRAANVINALLIAYAILRYQLLDTGLVIRKGLLYSIPTVIIGAAYFLVISGATRLFNALAGPQTFFVLSLAVAVLAAIVAQPLRDKAQYWVDRLFYREKYDASLMLQRLSEAAASILDLDRLTAVVLDEVVSTMHITSAAFLLKQTNRQVLRLTAQRGLDQDFDVSFGDDHPIVSWLTQHGKALSRRDVDMLPQLKALRGQEKRDLEKLDAELYIPLYAKGGLVGVFAVGSKRSTETYGQDDQLTLITLANQTAVAIENARLYEGLERTLQALRTAHDDFRTRVQERTAELSRVIKALQTEITERKRAEEELEQYASELERSNQELQQFAYVASHDLQEPLRMVTSYVQLLQRRYRGQLDSDADEFIAFAVDGATRMQALIKGLLTYSRVGTRGKPFEPTDTETTLNHTLMNLKLAIEESDTVVTHDPLPTVIADAMQMEQLLQNLIGNAIKFKREHPPRVHVGASRQNGEWIFSVQDNGIGIEPRYNDRIFLIFQRLHTRDQYPGTGIGLAVCKRIVERHNGRIWVQSEPDQGSTFYFTIPTAKSN